MFLFIQHIFHTAGPLMWVWMAGLLFLGGALLGFFPGDQKWRRTSAVIISGAAFFSGVLNILPVLFAQKGQTFLASFPFLGFAGGTELRLPGIQLLLDPASGLMLLAVLLVSFLVHVYSLGYMKDEENENRYWTFLAFFSFAMVMMTLAGNLFTLFLFWELVGLGSWMLIGFWTRKINSGKAAQKAMILNRVADAMLLCGILIILVVMEGGFFSSISDLAARWRGSGWITLGTLLIFGGVLGKSAQFPLQVWLPDAMAGPTPASAMIHAATMVAAGVFLLFRISPLIDPVAGMVIASAGVLTAILSALSATVTLDLKRILAWSTVSQLGFMVSAAGMAAEDAGFFHLLTHSVFKCGLFLGAGILIHAFPKENGDPQDIFNLGKVKYPMWLKIAFLFLLAGLAGVPFFSGFLSKESILTAAISWAGSDLNRMGVIGWILPGGLMLAFMLTAFYSARIFLLLFGSRSPKLESGFQPASVLKIPFLVTAIFTLGFFWSFPNLISVNDAWYVSIIHPYLDLGHGSGIWIPLISVGLILIGGGVAFWFVPKEKTESPSNGILIRHFGLDHFYETKIATGLLFLAEMLGRFDRLVIDGFINIAAGMMWGSGGRKFNLAEMVSWFEVNVIDRTVNGIAGAGRSFSIMLRATQPGKVQLWLLYAIGGILVILLIFILIFLS